MNATHAQAHVVMLSAYCIIIYLNCINRRLILWARNNHCKECSN